MFKQGELRFFDERSRQLHEHGFSKRPGPDTRPEQRAAHLVLAELHLTDAEQMLAEDIAGDSRMVACVQWAFGSEPTAAGKQTRERIMTEGFQGTLDELREEYEEAIGEPIDPHIFSRAWDMCREVTEQTRPATSDNVQ